MQIMRKSVYGAVTEQVYNYFSTVTFYLKQLSVSVIYQIDQNSAGTDIPIVQWAVSSGSAN